MLATVLAPRGGGAAGRAEAEFFQMSEEDSVGGLWYGWGAVCLEQHTGVGYDLVQALDVAMLHMILRLLRGLADLSERVSEKIADTAPGVPLGTLLGRKLSLNCLFAGRNNNNFDLCRPPGN